jgi:hypothetical protein
MKTRKTVLATAEKLWEMSYRDAQTTAHYNIMWEQMQYLRRNVRTKGLQFQLYKSAYDYLVQKVNAVYKEIALREANKIG